MELCVNNCSLVRQGRFFLLSGTFQTWIKSKRKSTHVLFLLLWLSEKKKPLWLIYPYVEAQMWYQLAEAEVTLQQDKNPKKKNQTTPVETTQQHKCPSVGCPETQFRQTSLKIIIIKHHWRTPSAEMNGRIIPNASVSHFHLVSNSVFVWETPLCVTHSTSLVGFSKPSLSPNT